MPIQHYQYLNLPKLVNNEAVSDLISLKLAKTEYNTYRTIFTNFKEYLTTESIAVFKSLNIFPDIFILFGHVGDVKRSNLTSHLHSDVTTKDGNYIDVPFAINYEVTNSVATMEWYDTKDAKKLYFSGGPEVNELDKLYAAGVHYGSFKNNDVSKYILLDSCELSSLHPVLINTSKPHRVTYPAGYESRLSISIRFPNTQLETFEQALDLFKRYDFVAEGKGIEPLITESKSVVIPFN